MADNDIAETIDKLAKDGVQRARGDQGDVTAYDLSELIEADQYACDKATSKKRLGFKAVVTQRGIPPGAP